MSKVTFTADPRTVTGKAVKKLRAQHLIPANIHGDLAQPIPVTVPKTAFEQLYDQVGDTSLVYLSVGEAKAVHPVLVDEVETSPVTGEVIHVVFKQVSLKEKARADIPIEFEGEYDVPESVLMVIRDSIEVEALPTDFPEKIVVDLSGFSEIGDSVLVSDLKVDASKVEIVDFEELQDKPVVLLQAQQEEEPEPEVESEEAEVGEGESGEAETEAVEDAEPADDEKTE